MDSLKKNNVKEVSSILDVFSIILGLIAGLVVAVISSLIFFRKGVEHRKRVAESEFESGEKVSQRIISEAERVAERQNRDALMQAREEIHKSTVEL